MNRDENLKYWENLALTFGGGLAATTRCHTVKRLEVEALSRAIDRYMVEAGNLSPVVHEIGCGNGVNVAALVERFPEAYFLGTDFSSNMIKSAEKGKVTLPESSARRLQFAAGDVRHLPSTLNESFKELHRDQPDIIFAVRMLINLSSPSEQLEALRRMKASLAPNGRLVIIEGSVEGHRYVNELRQLVELPFRSVAEFNVFIDEESVIAPFSQETNLVYQEDHTALHDLVLYCAQAASLNGEVQYDTVLMRCLTEIESTLRQRGADLGELRGQNRLWCWAT